MGYETYFILKMDGQEYREDLHKGIWEFFISKTDIGYVPHAETCKWYRYNDDMIELSRLYPHIKFELHGAGEDDGDLWITYYVNGKRQRCEGTITYEPFDINKLE